MKTTKMDFRKNNSPDEYYKAVHQLKQFLSESDSSDQQIYRSGLKVVWTISNGGMKTELDFFIYI